MLGSITPLGERSRHSRWWMTTTAYLLGSAASGAASGGVAGLVGEPIRLVLRPDWALLSLGLLILAGLVLDLGVLPVGIPTVRRQVNDEWLYRYRGWVYGLGFGVQLGAGFATVVSTAAVYSTLGAALLSGSPWRGGLIGLAFGTVRGGAVFAAARVHTPSQLLAVNKRLGGWEPASRRIVIAAQVLAAGAVGALAVAGPGLAVGR